MKVSTMRWLSTAVMAVMLASAPALAGFYLSPPVENLYTDSSLDNDQGYPNVEIDSSGNLQLVWQEFDTLWGSYPPYIVHTRIPVGGEPSMTGLVPYIGSCATFSCGFQGPQLASRCADPGLTFSYWGGTSNTDLFGGYYDDIGVMWAALPSINGYPLPANVAIATNDMNLGFYLVISDYSSDGINESGVKVRYWDMSSWSATADIEDTSSIIFYKHADIALDDDGYIYVVYARAESPPLLYMDIFIVRSSQPNDITGWETPILVENINGPAHPHLAVEGAYGTGDLLVSVVWEQPSSALCETRLNYDFTSGGNWDGAPALMNACTTCTVSDLDVQIIEDLGSNTDNRKILCVWQDNRSSNNAIYMAESHDLGVTFANDHLLSTPGAIAEHPRISTDDSDGNIAVVWEEEIGGLMHPVLRTNQAEFLDHGDDTALSNWDLSTGIEVSSEQSYDSGGTSYKFGHGVDRMERNYTGTVYGQFRFFFYDSLTTDVDWHMEINGTDGSKAIIGTMLGVQNEVDEAKYSKNVESTKAWEPIPGVMGDRIQGWHEVLVNVDPDGGCEVYLDPDKWNYPAIISSETPLTEVSQVVFTGGEIGFQDAYYVDEIRFATVQAANAPMDVPALTGGGIALLLAALGFFSVRRRRK